MVAATATEAVQDSGATAVLTLSGTMCDQADDNLVTNVAESKVAENCGDLALTATYGALDLSGPLKVTPEWKNDGTYWIRCDCDDLYESATDFISVVIDQIPLYAFADGSTPAFEFDVITGDAFAVDLTDTFLDYRDGTTVPGTLTYALDNDCSGELVIAGTTLTATGVTTSSGCTGKSVKATDGTASSESTTSVGYSFNYIHKPEAGTGTPATILTATLPVPGSNYANQDISGTCAIDSGDISYFPTTDGLPPGLDMTDTGGISGLIPLTTDISSAFQVGVDCINFE